MGFLVELAQHSETNKMAKENLATGVVEFTLRVCVCVLRRVSVVEAIYVYACVCVCV